MTLQAGSRVQGFGLEVLGLRYWDGEETDSHTNRILAQKQSEDPSILEYGLRFKFITLRAHGAKKLFFKSDPLQERSHYCRTGSSDTRGELPNRTMSSFVGIVAMPWFAVAFLQKGRFQVRLC